MIEFLLASISVASVVALMFKLVIKIRKLYSYRSLKVEDWSKIEEGVSVLICIKDREPQFQKYLNKIINQDYKLFEIVIVYEGKDEKMYAFFDSVKGTENLHIVDITSINSTLSGKKKAIHFGISVCQYQHILMIDGDCYPESPFWIAQMMAKKKGYKIVLGASPYISDSTWLNRWIRFDQMTVSFFYLSYTLSNKAYMGMGRNMLFDKSLWTDSFVEKYQKFGYGDDDMLVQSVRPDEVTIMIDSLVYSYPQKTWIGWLHQKLRHLKIGSQYPSAIVQELATYPVYSMIFWIAMWIWGSFFRMHVIWVLVLFLYIILKMLTLWMVEHQLKIKNKVWFLSPFFDFYYALMQLIFPFIALLYRVRWK
jgi:glycosyltransferase involved in cell wall biosynthesis